MKLVILYARHTAKLRSKKMLVLLRDTNRSNYKNLWNLNRLKCTKKSKSNTVKYILPLLLIVFLIGASITLLADNINPNILSNEWGSVPKAASNAKTSSLLQTFPMDSKKAAIVTDTDVSSFTIKTMQKYSKQEYLDKFYAVWNPNKINTNKESVFYILPSLQNAIDYAEKLEKLKKNPPNKNAKNYKKLLREYKSDISNLEKKTSSLFGAGENLMPNTLEEFKDIIYNMNLSAFLHNIQNAIVIKADSIRGVPSNKPRYKSANDFPFDRWQHSFVFEGTPLAITHFSKDGRFAHVQAPYISGWIDVRSIALVDKNTQKMILQFEDYKIPNKDFVPLYSKSQWVLDARIGQIFPYNKNHNKLIIFYKDANNYAQIREVDFNLSLFADFPLPFTNKDMANIINSMIGQKYGWGGIFGNRDCSSFTRDIFAAFGIFLPRNSAAQAQFGGGFIDLSKMNSEDKEKYIIENATPFGSVIWLHGHIMLYLGYTTINNKKRAIVAHNVWSVKPIINKKQENIRLGGVKLTTLHVGESFSSNTTNNLLISRVQGITNLYTKLNALAINLEHSGIDMSKLQITIKN